MIPRAPLTPRRKRARKHIALREQLAAALSMLLSQEERDELRDRKVPAKTVIALFSPDHNVLFALGGPDRWWNLTMLRRAPHKEKSRTDTSIVAKIDRLLPSQIEFQRRMLAKEPGQPRERKNTIPSRGFDKRPRPFGNRSGSRSR